MDNVVMFPSQVSSKPKFPIAKIRDGEIIAEIEAKEHASGTGVVFFVNVNPIWESATVSRDRVDALVQRWHIYLQRLFPDTNIPSLERAID